MKIYNLLPTNKSFLLAQPTLAKTAQDLIFSASTHHNRKIGLRDSSVCMYVFNFFRDAILISYTAGFHEGRLFS